MKAPRGLALWLVFNLLCAQWSWALPGAAHCGRGAAHRPQAEMAAHHSHHGEERGQASAHDHASAQAAFEPATTDAPSSCDWAGSCLNGAAQAQVSQGPAPAAARAHPAATPAAWRSHCSAPPHPPPRSGR